MTTLNLKDRSRTSSGENRPVLPTDGYHMKIIEAKLEDNTFEKPRPDGTLPQQIVLTWEMRKLTDDQEEAAVEAGEEWDEVRVWQRLNPYYGPVKDGGPSKFKAFIDGLRGQGFLADFDEEAFILESLVGIEQKVMIERYTKTMGQNAGQPGNKVLSVSPLRKPKGAKAQDEPAAKAPVEEY